MPRSSSIRRCRRSAKSPLRVKVVIENAFCSIIIDYGCLYKAQYRKRMSLQRVYHTFAHHASAVRLGFLADFGACVQRSLSLRTRTLRGP